MADPNYPNDYRRMNFQFPHVERPYIDGYFSVDEERRYVNDLSNLKYFKTPDKKEVTIDLNTKLSTFCEKSGEYHFAEKLDKMLEYILLNFDRLLNKTTNQVELMSDFVTLRGHLLMLMCLPYEYNDFVVSATKYKNSIYLVAEENERMELERLNRTTDMQKFLKYGFIFEHFMLNDGPEESTHKKDYVVQSEEFSCVFSTTLEGHSMLYGAEIDGVKSNQIIRNLDDLRKSEFIELKLKKKPSDERQERNLFKYHTKYWWAQSFLVGIENICVGYRDDEGIVKELVNMHLRDIVRHSRSYWSPSNCLNFLNDFLTKVKEDMDGIDCPYTVFKYVYDPEKDKKINLTKFLGKNLSSFLPEHYITVLENHSKNSDTHDKVGNQKSSQNETSKSCHTRSQSNSCFEPSQRDSRRRHDNKCIDELSWRREQPQRIPRCKKCLEIGHDEKTCQKTN